MTEPEFQPPVAAVRPHIVASPHGDRTDPYYWLRDDERTNPEVLAYLAAENAYWERCTAAGKPFENALYEEIISRVKQDDSSVPYRMHGYWYHTRFAPGQEHPIFGRRKGSLEAPEDVMLDANLLAVGHDYYRIGAMEISPDSEWLAFCEDTVGRRQYTLRFKNLRTGEILDTAISDVESDLAWANDNRTILYVAKDPETLLGLYVKKARAGPRPAPRHPGIRANGQEFPTRACPNRNPSASSSSTWKARCPRSGSTAHADDPALEFRTFLPHERDHEYQLEHLGGVFIVRTNWQAKNFRLMQVPIGQNGDRAGWRDVVPHRDDTFIEDFDVFNGFLAVSVRSGGLAKISIAPWTPGGAVQGGAVQGGAVQGGAEFFIASDEAAYATSLSVNAELDTEFVRYAYSSLTTRPPSTITTCVPERRFC